MLANLLTCMGLWCASGMVYSYSFHDGFVQNFSLFFCSCLLFAYLQKGIGKVLESV